MSNFTRSLIPGAIFAALAAGAAPAQTAPPGTTYAVLPKAGIPRPPDPGTIAVSIGGLFQWLIGDMSTSGQSHGGQKLASASTLGFARLFFGMDGQSGNGIRYGSQFQIRENFGVPSGSAAPNTGSGGSTLYVRTGYAYVGTPSFGTLKLGAAGGPQTAFGYGMFESFNDGAWNGDAPDLVPSNTQPIFPFADSSALYTTDKISYFSPTFGGVDFGLSWEPAFVTLNDATSCATGAAGALSSCDDLASSTIAADVGKRRNTFDGMLRYRGAFGAVGVAIAGGYIGGGVVDGTGTTGGVANQRYRGLSVGSLGTEVTYAGITVGGHYYGGRMNGDWGLQPKGGAGANAYLLGGQYQLGPAIVGASYFNYQNQGDDAAPATEGQRAGYGIAAGGTWLLTPGIGVFLAYLYGERKQAGYDFLAQAAGPLNNQVRAQVVGVGVTLQW